MSHLPALVAGPARAYVEAMLPEADVADAWYDLQSDVAYWGDRDVAAVLHLAHEIVRQRLRVTDEATALALLEAAEVDDPATVARALGIEVVAAENLLARAHAALRGGDIEPLGAVSDVVPAVPDGLGDAAPGHDMRADTATADDAPADARFAQPPANTRISFDDTSSGWTPPPTHVEEASTSRPRTRVVLVWAAVIWAVILIAWLLGAFD